MRMKQAAFNWEIKDTEAKSLLPSDLDWKGDLDTLLHLLSQHLSERQMENLALELMNEYIYPDVWVHTEAVRQEIDLLVYDVGVHRTEEKALLEARNQIDQIEHLLFRVVDRLDSEHEKAGA